MTENVSELMTQIHNRIVTNNTTSSDLVILYERAISGEFIPEYIAKDFDAQNDLLSVTPPESHKGWIKVLDKIGLGKNDSKLTRRSNTADMIVKKKEEKVEKKKGSSSSITPRI